jgi:phage/plasmid-like protein (TIGR03299 family)
MLIMAANVESMFYVREAPWHGLGKGVEQALNSEEALQEAGLDWTVIQKTIQTEDSMAITGYKANIRETDQRVLGVVTDRYKIVQNHEAFAFTDELLGEGVKYETAGSLQNGKKVWLLAKLPDNYIISGDRISPYMVFSNSHDGSGSIKIAMTPIRIVCQNTLNLALSNAKRIWTTTHTGDMKSKLDEARKTILLAENYMDNLGAEVDRLNRIKVSDHKVLEYINLLIPLQDNATKQQEKNVQQLRSDMQLRYFDAPDLAFVGKNGYRFINAVSDFATHSKPLRETATFKENMFLKTVEGNPLIDKAYELILASA